MKTVGVTILLSVVCLALESTVVKLLGTSVARIDVTAAIVVWLALRATTVEGLFAAYACGWLLDLMSGRPTGLYTFLAVLIFLLVRGVDQLVEVRRPVAFALFAVGADLARRLLAALLELLTSKASGVFGASLSGLLGSLLLTGLAALALYPLLKKLLPGEEREAPGLLR